MNERRQIVITDIYDKKALVYMENERLMDIRIEPDEGQDGPAVGNIYVGKVQNIVKNISAAFVEIQKGMLCYMPLSDVAVENKKIRCGDEIVVQVIKPAVKTKQAVVSPFPEFAGRYAVVSTRDLKKGISKKITDRIERDRLKEVLKEFENEEYGLVLRTSSERVSSETLKEECEKMLAMAHTCMDSATYRTCFSMLQGEKPFYLSYLYGCDLDNLSRIVTDDSSVYAVLQQEFAGKIQTDPEFISLYEDPSYSLDHLLGITSKIEKEALSKRVWLKSGGNLVIEPTEALTVIDVNTGKAVDGKRNKETTFFKINCEAAVEAARQLRIRNISGIILIDFIDMKKEENRQELLNLLREELKKDKTRAVLIDITRLGLVELTRMKKNRSLQESLQRKTKNT